MYMHLSVCTLRVILSVVKKVITPPALGKISQTIRERQSLFPTIGGTISLKEGNIFVIASAESKFSSDTLYGQQLPYYQCSKSRREAVELLKIHEP